LFEIANPETWVRLYILEITEQDHMIAATGQYSKKRPQLGGIVKKTIAQLYLNTMARTVRECYTIDFTNAKLLCNR